MIVASAFNEQKYFSLDHVMAITGENREEPLQRIEQYRQELIEAGENPDDYFKPIGPQRAAVYYFPNGLLKGDSVTLLGEFFKKIIGNTRFLCYNVINHKNIRIKRRCPYEKQYTVFYGKWNT